MKKYDLTIMVAADSAEEGRKNSGNQNGKDD